MQAALVLLKPLNTLFIASVVCNQMHLFIRYLFQLLLTTKFKVIMGQWNIVIIPNPTFFTDTLVFSTTVSYRNEPFLNLTPMAFSGLLSLWQFIRCQILYKVAYTAYTTDFADVHFLHVNMASLQQVTCIILLSFRALLNVMKQSIFVFWKI